MFFNEAVIITDTDIVMLQHILLIILSLLVVSSCIDQETLFETTIVSSADSIGHILGGQIGSMSSELSHIGILFPLTQLQTHAAFAGEKAICAAIPKVIIRAVKK